MNRILRAAEALGIPKVINFKSKLAKIAAVATALSGLALNAGMANAATLTSARMNLSDPRPSATSSYNFTASSTSNTLIKCVKEVFATTATGSTKPTNMTTASGITVNASSTLLTAANWSRGGSDADGTVTFTYATGETPAAGTKSFNLDGFVNSSVADTAFFVRYSTYGNTDCSTTPVDSVTVEYILTNGSTLSLSVDPTLTFTVNGVSTGTSGCAGGTSNATTTATTIPFGTVTASTNGLACQDLTAASNSTGGYTIYARYTAAPTNTLGQTIADWTGTNASPTTFTAAGTEAYGYSTNDVTLGTGTAGRFSSNKFAALTTSNDEVAYESAGVTSTTYRIAHEVAVSTLTKPGTYQTTVIYTCTPVY